MGVNKDKIFWMIQMTTIDWLPTFQISFKMTGLSILTAQQKMTRMEEFEKKISWNFFFVYEQTFIWSYFVDAPFFPLLHMIKNLRP